MNTYTLFERPDGRVILGTPNIDKGDIPLRTVEATSWLEARHKCLPFEGKLIVLNPGHGWIKR